MQARAVLTGPYRAAVSSRPATAPADAVRHQARLPVPSRSGMGLPEKRLRPRTLEGQEQGAAYGCD